MKKLLLGAVMAAFVVTGAYGDDVIDDNMQTAYIGYVGDVNKCLKDTSKTFPGLKAAMSNLGNAMNRLLTIDQDDVAKKSEEYSKRKNKLILRQDGVIELINKIDIKGNEEKLKEFKAQVLLAKVEGDELFKQDGSKKKIQSNFEGDTESKSNIENAYREVRHLLYTCWSDIEKALTNKGIKTDEELAGEAAKKAAEEAAAKKAAEEEEKAEKEKEKRRQDSINRIKANIKRGRI